jgi:hypothetical protein
MCCAAWQDTLISISFVYGCCSDYDLKDHAPDPRLLSLLACTANGKGAGTALRRGAAPHRPYQRAILAHGVSEPARTARNEGSGVAAGDGSDYVDRGSQALAAPRAGADLGGPGGPPRATDDSHGKRTKSSGPRGSHLEKEPCCRRSASPPWRRQSASQQSTRALVTMGNIPMRISVMRGFYTGSACNGHRRTCLATAWPRVDLT